MRKEAHTWTRSDNGGAWCLDCEADSAKCPPGPVEYEWLADWQDDDTHGEGRK
jgi:hypothetical protein